MDRRTRTYMPLLGLMGSRPGSPKPTNADDTSGLTVAVVEPRRRPRSDYIEAVQSDVTANMRTILVDWLVEVAEEYKLVADTLYLAISYVDRFLSANALSRDRLQLLGVAAMLIAALTIDPDVNPWNKKLQKVTGYKASELKDCIIAIHDLQLNRKCSSLMAIRDKYKQHKFKFVSTLLPPVVIPASYLEDLAE
uniref:Uncharacterized protein n=1 Tax=Setaria italica TaxID=4555 RepID=K3ZCY6_SETIT